MTTEATERRKHRRFPLSIGTMKPLNFRFDGFDHEVPAILVNLSAGGLSMVCFTDPPRIQEVSMRLELPGIAKALLKGRVVRMIRKGETCLIGVQITEFRKKWASIVSKMARAWRVCEDRLAEGERNFCFRSCAYFPVCEKQEKARVFPKSAEPAL